MNTNAGAHTLNLKAEVPAFGKVYYDPDHIANIFGLAKMVDTADYVTFDSRIDDAFHVWRDERETIFARTPANLYTCKPTAHYLEQIATSKNMLPPPDDSEPTVQATALIDDAFAYHFFMHPNPAPDDDPEFQFLLKTVTDNLKLYTKCKQKDAKLASIAFHGTGRKPIPKLKAFIKGGYIRDCSVLSEDVDRAVDIFGPNCSHLKGTSTHPRPPHICTPDVTEIPCALRTEISPLTLYLDIMPMLTTVDSHIKYRALVPLKNRTAESLYDFLNNVLRCYNRATIYATSIDSDIEFKSLFEDIEDNMDAKFNYAPQGQHVPAVKRNNRTIADCICVAVHYLPYRNIPRLLLKHVAVYETEKLNWFPAEGGLSDTFTPHQFLELPPIDWNNDKDPSRLLLPNLH